MINLFYGAAAGSLVLWLLIVTGNFIPRCDEHPTAQLKLGNVLVWGCQ